MKKLEKLKINIILSRLQGDYPYGCLQAIKDCAIHQIKEKEIIDILKELKHSHMADWVKVSDAAIAALHILGVEKYCGDNPTICETIETNFYESYRQGDKNS